MRKGWIKLHRKVFENKYYFAEKFTKMQAWIDILLLANHEDGYFEKRGIGITIKRGQLGCSEKTLSKRWLWSRGKVRRFLDILETEQQIVQQKNNITTLISVVNYGHYQKKDTQTGQQTDTKQDSRRTPDSTTDGTQTRIIKNDKKEKNDKEIKERFAFFENETFQNAWTEYLKMRLKIRKSATPRAKELILIELVKLTDDNTGKAILILEQSIKNSWPGVFFIKNQNNEKTAGRYHAGKSDYTKDL